MRNVLARQAVMTFVLTACGGQVAPPVTLEPGDVRSQPERQDQDVQSDGQVVAAEPLLEPIEPPRPETAGAETCVVEGFEELAKHQGRLRTIAVAYGALGGLVAWEHDSSHVKVVPIDENGRALAEARTVDMPLGHRIYKIYPVDDRFLLLTFSVCIVPNLKRITAYCSYMRALERDGTPLGEPVMEKVGERFSIQDARPMGDGLETHRYAVWNEYEYELYRYHIEENGEVRGEVVNGLKHITGSDEHSWRRCGTEGERVVLVTWQSYPEKGGRLSSEGNVPLVGLLPPSKVHACDPSDGGLTLIYSPYTSSGGDGAPRLARFNAKGRLIERPRVLKQGEPVPEPFEDRVRIKVDYEEPEWGYAAKRSTTIWLERWDLLGRQRGQKLKIATPGRSRRERSALGHAWTGQQFLVAFGDFENESWNIKLARIRCATQSE